MLDMLNDLIVVSAVIPLALFIYYYGRYSPWRSTSIGRTMMIKNVAFLSVITVIVTGLYFGEYPGRDYVRFVVYTGVVAAFWMNLYTLRRVQTQHPGKIMRFLHRLNPKNRSKE